MNPRKSDPLYLEAFIKTYLKDEIHPEGLTRNLSAFARLLEAKSFSQGPMLNISSVGREGHVERKVVENYFFEIKRTARITSSILVGLKSFLADYPMAKAYFLYMGTR